LWRAVTCTVLIRNWSTPSLEGGAASLVQSTAESTGYMQELSV
jgi:hypothetical protein